MNQYDYVIFDLDGTLIETSESVILSIMYVLEGLSENESLKENISDCLEPTIYETFKNHTHLNEKSLNKAVMLYNEIYEKKYIYNAKSFYGINDVLEYLKAKGINIFIATCKREDIAKKLLNMFHLQDLIYSIYGNDSHNSLSKTEIILKILYDYKIPTNRVLMIGDTYNDALSASRVGIEFIAVTYGYGFKTKAETDNCKCLAFAESPMELDNILRRII